MTSKNSFWKFSIWNFKKRAWTFALCALIWFFALPVAMFMNGGQMMEAYSDTIAMDRVWIQEFLINNHISGSGFYGFLAIAMAMFLGIHSYAWNNHQQKVDMYKAVPIKASARFWYINLNSLWIFVITFGGSLIIANFIAAMYGVWAVNFLYASLLSFIMHLLLFMASYCVVLIAQYLTGNIVLGFMGSAILLLIEPACYFLREGLKTLFYKTYAGSASYQVIEDGIFTPLAPYVKAYKSVSMNDDAFADIANYGNVWLPLILLVVHIIIYGSIAYMLYQKRPAQTGGKTMIFPKTKPVIKCVLMVVGSLYFGGIMISLSGDIKFGYGVFGVICGLLIIHVVLQSIMEGGFKEALKGKIGFGIATVLTFAIYLGYAFDVTGYDTYLPEAEEVESFAFVRSGDYVYDLYDEQGNYVSTRDYFGENMAITDEASKEMLLTMLQTAMDNDDYCKWDYEGNSYVASTREIATAEAMWASEVSCEDGNEQEAVTVTFRLVNGKEVERSYILRLNDIRSLWATIYELPEYKELAYMILKDDVKNTLEEAKAEDNLYGMVSYHTYGTELSDYNSRSVELLEQFYAALCEDISGRSAETVLSSAPIGQFSWAIEDKWKNNIYHLDMPVYEADSNTVALLKEQGWYRENGIDEDNILSVVVYQYVDDGNDCKVLEVSADAAYYEDMVDSLILTDAFNYVIDAGAVVKNAYGAEITVLVDGMTYSYSCSFDKNTFPEELEKAFEDVPLESELMNEEGVD